MSDNRDNRYVTIHTYLTEKQYFEFLKICGEKTPEQAMRSFVQDVIEGKISINWGCDNDKKIRCNICGNRFFIKKESIYLVEENLTFSESLTRKPRRCSAIDCPHCGCQILLAARLPHINVSNNLECADK